MSEELKHELERLAAEMDLAAKAADIQPGIPYLGSLAPDQPIESSSEDRLNRTGFARELARAITEFARPESIVIGIYGRWGTGKTSLINLIEEQLEEIASQPPVVFRFNAWGFSDQDQLTSRFFIDLSAFLRLHQTFPSLVKAADTLEEYGKSLSPIGELLSPRATKALRSGWTLFRTLRPLRTRTIAEIKIEIDSYLRAAKTKLIIMIDDIDRLNTDEIRQVFQLIKLNANFINTIFLVAFDNTRIEKALQGVAPGPASEYLEKIVQVAFVLPPIPETTLTQIILADIDETIATVEIKGLDVQRLGNMFHSGFRQSFRTIRDVNRYFNLLRFAVRLVGQDTNFVDLAGMQALSLFYPKVYSEIQNNAELFLGDGSLSDTRQDKENLKVKYEAIFEQAPEGQREYVRSLTIFLFPRLGRVFETFGLGYSTEFEKIWRQNKQVASKKYFPYYFHLAIPDTEVTQSQFDRAIDTTVSVSSFVDTLRKFKTSGKFPAFVGMLRDSLKRVDRQQLLVILQSIFVFGDEVDTRGTSGVLGTISEHIQFAMWLLFDIIDLLDKERFGRAIEAMHTKNAAPFTTSNFVNICEQIVLDKGKTVEREKYSDLTPELVEEMKRVAVEVIHVAAADKRLAQSPELPRVLLLWKQWENIQTPIAWVRGTFLTGGKQAADFVSRFLQPVTTFGFHDKVPEVHWTLSFGVLREFADINIISQLLANVADSELDDRQRLARDEFYKAKEKYDKGIDPDIDRPFL